MSQGRSASVMIMYGRLRLQFVDAFNEGRRLSPVTAADLASYLGAHFLQYG